MYSQMQALVANAREAFLEDLDEVAEEELKGRVHKLCNRRPYTNNANVLPFLYADVFIDDSRGVESNVVFQKVLLAWNYFCSYIFLIDDIVDSGEQSLKEASDRNTSLFAPLLKRAEVIFESLYPESQEKIDIVINEMLLAYAMEEKAAFDMTSLENQWKRFAMSHFVGEVICYVFSEYNKVNRDWLKEFNKRLMNGMQTFDDLADLREDLQNSVRTPVVALTDRKETYLIDLVKDGIYEKVCDYIQSYLNQSLTLLKDVHGSKGVAFECYLRDVMTLLERYRYYLEGIAIRYQAFLQDKSEIEKVWEKKLESQKKSCKKLQEKNARLNEKLEEFYDEKKNPGPGC